MRRLTLILSILIINFLFTFIISPVIAANNINAANTYDGSSSLDAGLVGYWSFDDGTAIDGSGNSNHGTIYGATQVTGICGNALSFNGNSDYVLIPHSSSLDITGDISILAWIKPMTPSGAAQPIVAKGTHVNNYSYYFGLNYGWPTFQIRPDCQALSETEPPLNDWHHIVAVRNGTEASIYLNGTNDTTEICSFSGISDAGFDILIGYYPYTQNWHFTGIIDEVRIYNRALNPSEIQTLYEYCSGQAPMIELEPITLEFLATQIGILPQSHTFNITNSGDGTLIWEISDDAVWLDISPDSGESNNETITASINTTDLSVGQYTATITVSSPNASNSPQTIDVVYNIIDEGCINIGNLVICADSMTFDGSVYTASGNVRINDLLFIDNDLTIDLENLKLNATDASIEIRNIPYVPGNTVILWEGDIDFTVEEDILKDLVNPEFSKIELAGLKIELSNITLILDGENQGVSLEGNLTFPTLIGLTVSITNITVTSANGVQFAGSISLSNDIKIKGLLLKSIVFEFNTQNDEFGSDVIAAIPKVVDMIRGRIYIRGSCIDEVGLDVRLTNGVPIDATGISLTGGTGHVENMCNPSLNNPAVITLAVDLTGGPQIGGYSILSLDSMAVTIRPPISLIASGDFKIFEQNVASGSVEYNRGNSKINVNFSMNLANILDASFTAGLSSEELSGSAEGNFFLPECTGTSRSKICELFGGTQLGWANATFLNDSLWGEASSSDICVPFLGCIRIGFAFVLKYQGDGNWDFWIGDNFDELEQIFKKQDSKGELFAGFDNPQNTPELLLLVEGSSGPVPSFEIIGPDDVYYDSTQIPMARFDDKWMAFYVIENPAPGTWQIHIPEDNGESFQFYALRRNCMPNIYLTEPSTTTESGLISWVASDQDNNAEINLYYDSDNSGFDGTRINPDPIYEDGTINSYTWDTENIPSGRYYIYASIKDSSNAPYFVYAPGVIEVSHPWQPPTPGGLFVRPWGTDFIVYWAAWKEEILGYTIHYTKDTNATKYDNFVSIGETDSCVISDLTFGRHYKFAVSCYDTSGNISFLSDPVVVRFEDTLGNNLPQITSTNPPDHAIEDGEYSYMLTATDFDSDPIDFLPDSVPDGFQILSDQIQWTPDSNQLGLNYARIIATDNNGGYDTLEYEIIVFSEASSSGKLDINKSRFNSELDNIIMTVTDMDLDSSQIDFDSALVNLSSTSDNFGINIWLHEVSPSSGRFVGIAGFSSTVSDPINKDILVNDEDSIYLRYEDVNPSNQIIKKASWVEYICGDPNRDDFVNIFDITFTISYLYLSGPAPDPLESADINSDGMVNIFDITGLIAYLYMEGVAPSCP